MPRFQHIYRCPRCYVKLCYIPTSELPCSICGYPDNADPELRELLRWARNLKRRRRKVEPQLYR